LFEMCAMTETLR